MSNAKGTLLLLLGGLTLGIVAGKFGLPYALILAMLVLLPVALIRKPIAGLYLLAFYSVADFLLQLQGGALAGLWDELLFIGIVGASLTHLIFFSKEFNYRMTSMDIPIFIFFGVIIFILLVNSLELDVAIDGARVLLQYILWYFIAVNIIKDKVTVKKLLNVLIIVTAFIALYGVYQYLTGAEIPSHWVDQKETTVSTRAFSIIGSPNILGSLLVLFIPINFAFILSEKRIVKKGLYLGTFLVMMACLIFTLSRGAWLAFALAVLIYALIKDRRLIIPIVILGVIALVAVPQIADRITYLLSPEYLASSARGGRLYRWAEAIKVFQEHPWFGVGLGRFGGATAMRYKIPGAFYADNFYIKTLAEIGIVGISAFLFMLYRGVIEALKVLRKIKDSEFYNLGVGIFTGLIGVLAHNAVENVFEVPMMTSYFWFVLAILLSFRFIGVTGSEVKES